MTINFYNEQFLSETSKKDRIFYKGIGFIFLIKIIFLIGQIIFKGQNARDRKKIS